MTTRAPLLISLAHETLNSISSWIGVNMARAIRATGSELGISGWGKYLAISMARPLVITERKMTNSSLDNFITGVMHSGKIKSLVFTLSNKNASVSLVCCLKVYIAAVNSNKYSVLSRNDLSPVLG